jgi:hypothetical protein
VPFQNRIIQQAEMGLPVPFQNRIIPQKQNYSCPARQVGEGVVVAAIPQQFTPQGI